MIETTWNITDTKIIAEYLFAPITIVFPGIPVIIKETFDLPIDPDDLRTTFVLRSIEEMVDEAAGSAERNGYTTYEDERVDMELF